MAEEIKKELKELKSPEWVKMKPAELEKLVIELYKQGESTAKIGLLLRDKHGIPKAKLLGKKITKILKDAKIEVKSEKEKIQKEMEELNRHLEKNKHDITAKRCLMKKLWALSKIKD